MNENLCQPKCRLASAGREWSGADCPQQFGNGRTICGSRPDVVEPYDSRGIDEDVAGQLMHIGARSFQASSPQEQLEVNPDGGGAEQLPPSAPGHAVSLVE